MKRLAATGVVLTLMAGISMIQEADPALSETAIAGAPASQASPLRVLAAGDSYAAGEGLPNIQDGEGACQRALGQKAEGDETPSKAWPVLVKETFERASDDARWTVDPFWFVACTGNRTPQFAREATQRGQNLSQLAEAQAGAGDEPWDVIMLSFGGNDVGFSKIIQDCIGLETTFDDVSSPESILLGGGAPALLNGSFAGCTMTEAEMKARVESVLPGVLEQLYSEAAEQARPGSLIVVTGYPQLFAEPSTWSSREKLINRCNRVSEGDARAIRGATGYLNRTIGAAVERAKTTHRGQTWVFVDVNDVWEADGQSHALCGPDEWINGFSLNGITDGDLRALDPGPLRDIVARAFNRSYHPNQAGHDGYALITANRMRRSRWRPTVPEPTRALSLQGEDACSVVAETIAVERRWVAGAAELVEQLAGAEYGPSPLVLVDGRTVDVYVTSPSGESVVRYRITRGDGVEGPVLVSGDSPEGPVGTGEEIPSGGLQLSVGQTGVSVLHSDGVTPICSFRYDGDGRTTDAGDSGAGASATYLCVTGVASDDVLNLRSEPSPNAVVVHEIPPHACDIHGTGRTQPFGDSTWIEVDFYDHVFHARGWVNARFVEERPNPCGTGDVEGCGQ